jgi:uncharacterized OB-fold protein
VSELPAGATPAEVLARYRDAAREGRLLLQRCAACRRFVHYPRLACPHCRGLALDWVEASGRGTVYAFSVVRQPPSEQWSGRVPYVLALIALEEGPRMMANVVGCAVDDVRCDLPVTVVFEERDGRVLPQFRPS